jgi:hypothetical protein
LSSKTLKSAQKRLGTTSRLVWFCLIPEHKDVIPPPPIGDEDIYTEAPNPEAGHEEEAIPPPAPEEEQETTEPSGDR